MDTDAPTRPNGTEKRPPSGDPPKQGHADVVARLRRQFDETLGPVVPRTDAPYALLDFPDYSNVGDSAIWLGGLAWLKQRTGTAPAFVSKNDASRAELDESLPEGPIFLCGGGNFGDLWPQHQEFREGLLERYPDRPIIQLPQSIHYDDERLIAKTARAIAMHGAFTLLVRDHESLALARRSFDCDVHLCPDMAFALGSLPRPASATSQVLMLLRTDKEKALDGDGPASLPDGWSMDDWLEDEPGMYEAAFRRARVAGLMRPRLRKRDARRGLLFEDIAARRLKRGLRLLASAQCVITDRLHGHILSTLLGIPHVVLDNRYGKISRFSQAFDSLWAETARAGTLDEARALAVGMA